MIGTVAVGDAERCVADDVVSAEEEVVEPARQDARGMEGGFVLPAGEVGERGAHQVEGALEELRRPGVEVAADDDVAVIRERMGESTCLELAAGAELGECAAETGAEIEVDAGDAEAARSTGRIAERNGGGDGDAALGEQRQFDGGQFGEGHGGEDGVAAVLGGIAAAAVAHGRHIEEMQSEAASGGEDVGLWAGIVATETSRAACAVGQRAGYGAAVSAGLLHEQHEVTDGRAGECAGPQVGDEGVDVCGAEVHVPGDDGEGIDGAFGRGTGRQHRCADAAAPLVELVAVQW